LIALAIELNSGDIRIYKKKNIPALALAVCGAYIRRGKFFRELGLCLF